jgi:hypothetical protein
MSVTIFFSYAHEDEPLLIKLKSHLKPLQRQGLIDVWYDRDIDAGTEWESDINQHLNAAQIILLLVSPDFMSSDYINNVEMKRAIERHKNGEARVIPIILRPVYWQEEFLGKLQALPTDGRPVMSPAWHNLDEAFFNVTEGIRKVILNLSSRTVDNEPQGLQPEKAVIQTQTIQNGWESAGAIGEIIGTLAKQQQWGQAEAMARSIENISIRSLIQHKLVDELIKAQQWERAEAITRTIEDRNHKDKALIELVNGLAGAEQWARAEGMARSIYNARDRVRILNELSRRLANAGETGRARLLAYEAMMEAPVTEAPLTLKALPERVYHAHVVSRRSWLIALIALVFLGVLLAVINNIIISHNPIPLFIVLGIIGIGLIGVLIATIFRRIK